MERNPGRTRMGTGLAAATFDLDDVAVWVRSQWLLDDPLGDERIDADESGSSEFAPRPTSITVHADPPYCSGSTGLNECAHVPATITGSGFPLIKEQTEVKFRVAYGGIYKTSPANITSVNGSTEINITIPNSPYPSRFTTAQIKVKDKATGDVASLSWSWNNAARTEEGFRYGYPRAPVSPYVAGSHQVFNPWGETPDIYAVSDYHTFKQPSGSLLYPTARIFDPAGVFYPTPQFPTGSGPVGEDINVNWRDSASAGHYRGVWFGRVASPPVCMPGAPCMRTGTRDVKFHNPGVGFLPQSLRDHLTALDDTYLVAFSREQSLLPYGEGIVPTCRETPGTIDLFKSTEDWFIRVMGVSIFYPAPGGGSWIYKTLQGLHWGSRHELTGDLPGEWYDPHHDCCRVAIYALESGNNWVSCATMFRWGDLFDRCPAVPDCIYVCP